MTSRSILCALVVASLLALLGGGTAFVPPIVRDDPGARLQGVSRDGWIMQGGEIRIEGLLQAGNKLALELNNWRPPGVAPAVIGLSVCGEAVGRILVDKKATYFVSLAGSCEPRTVMFDIANPFVAGQGDTRLLGVQLQKAHVTSPLGIPLLKLRTLLTLAAALFLPSLFLLLAYSGIGGQALAFAVLLGEGWILARSDWGSDSGNLLVLWGGLLIVALGVMCAAWHGHQAEGRVRANGLDRGSGITEHPLLLLAMVALVALGGCIRFYGITFGLPAPFHPDETPKVNALMAMDAAGTLNPKYFLHPSLLLYLTYFLEKFLALFMTDWGQDPLLRLSGRLVSATAGTLSVAVLFNIGWRIFGPFVAVFSSALLAVAPLSVTCSRYLKEDTLMTLWFLVVVSLVVRAVQERRPTTLMWAGLFAGFAAGTKYTGVLVLGVIAIAPWLRSGSLRPDGAFLRSAIYGALVAGLGFLMVTPYAVLDFGSFFKGVMSEKNHMERGHTFAITASSQYWMYHLRRSVIPGLTPAPTVLALLGVGLLLWRRRLEDLWIVALVLLFYLPAEWVRAKPAPQPERYMVPCIPFLALAAAEFVRVAAHTKFRKVIPIFATVAVGLAAAKSVLLASEVPHDTRLQLASWIDENVPQGSTILIDYPPYDPPISATKYQIVRFPPGELMQRLSVESLKNEKANYLVLSSLVYDRFFSQPNESSIRRAILRRTFRDVPIAKQFRPKQGTYGFHNPTVTLFHLDRAEFDKLAEENRLVRLGELERTSNEVRASLRVEQHSQPGAN